MKPVLFLSATASVLIGLASPMAHAVENAPAAPPKMAAPQQQGALALVDLKKQLDANFGAMDANHDGSISPAELMAGRNANLERQKAAAKQRRAEMFNRLDSNKDGVLSRVEWEAGNILPPPPAVDVSKMFARLDSNKDSKLSAQELQAPALQDFAKRDTDKNGVLSGQELKPLPAQK